MYDCACVQHQLLPRGIGLHWFHPVQRPGLNSLLCFFPWLIFLEAGSLQGYDAVLFGSVRKRVLQSLNRFHLSSPRRHWHGPSCHYHVFYVFKVDWTSFMKESCLPDLVSSTSFVVSDPAVSWRTFHPASSLRLLSRCQYYASSCSVLQDPASLLSPKINRPPLQSHTLWPGIYRVRVFCFPFGRAILCRSLLSIHKHFLQQSFFFF